MIPLLSIILGAALIVGWWYGVRRHYSPIRKNIGTPWMNGLALVALVFLQLTNLRWLRGIWTEAIVLGLLAETAMLWVVLSKPARP